MDPWATPPTPEELQRTGAAGGWDTPPTPEELSAAEPKTAPPRPISSEFDPTKGMTPTELWLSGAGRGMINVGANVGDIVGHIPGLGFLRPSPEWRAEFDRTSAPLLAAQRPSGAQAPVTFQTGDPSTDAQIAANVESRYGEWTPGKSGNDAGAMIATAPVAAGAGKLSAPVVGRLVPAAAQFPVTTAIEGAAAGGTGAEPGHRAESALIGGAAGGLLGTFLQAGGMAPAPASRTSPGPLSEKLSDWAESAAVRSANQDRTAYRRAFAGNEDQAREVGRFMLDEGVPLRSPAKIKDAALEIGADAGPKIGQLLDAADKAGAKVDLQSAVAAAKASPAVARLAQNTETKGLYDRVTAMLDDQVAQNGGAVSPTTAHDIRRQLDTLADFSKADPKPLTAAWRRARSEVNSALDDAMGNAGLDSEWADANARFAAARTLANPKTHKGLADIGAERRSGNRLGSPSEKAAAIAGAVVAGMHEPMTGVAIPVATAALNRFGLPATAHALDWLSKVAARSGSAPADPEVSALISMLRDQGRLTALPAAAEDEQARRRTPGGSR